MSNLAWVMVYDIFLLAVTTFLIAHTGNWLWVFLFVAGGVGYEKDSDEED